MPIVRLTLGRRVFAPSWTMTALTLAACAVFVHLGEWQWHRAEWRQAEWDAFARGADAAVTLAPRGAARGAPSTASSGPWTAGVPRFQRVVVAGRFDPAHQFLLDNRTENDEAGYEVLTPLMLGGGRVLLVDRGWVPFTGYRSRLPDIRLEATGPVRVSGRVDDLPAAGLSFGRRAPPPGSQWPKVTSYPSMSQLAVALGSVGVPGPALEPRILLLDPGEPFGYVRKWRPPGMSPARYMSYAAQWWLFAVTLAIIWAVLSTPRASPPGPRSTAPSGAREREVH